MGRFYFSGFRKARDVQIFSGAPVATNAVPEKSGARKIHEGRRKKINSVSEIFDFRENDYNSAENTDFWARSNFNSFSNFGPLMTNDGALES